MSDKNIPLSDLIRIGSKITGKCRCRLHDPITNTTCAVGAAYLAKFGEASPLDMGMVMALNRCGVNPKQPVKIHFDSEEATLSSTIAYLNDYERWSREKIADWLESIGL